MGMGWWLTPPGKEHLGSLLGKDETRTEAGPSKTPALSSSSWLEENFVLPSTAHKAFLPWAPHPSTFILADSRDKPSSLVQPASTFLPLPPFPCSVPWLVHALLLLHKRFGLANGSLSWPSVVPTSPPHSTCCLIGPGSFVSTPYGELGSPCVLDVDGSKNSWFNHLLILEVAKHLCSQRPTFLFVSH